MKFSYTQTLIIFLVALISVACTPTQNSPTAEAASFSLPTTIPTIPPALSTATSTAKPPPPTSVPSTPISAPSPSPTSLPAPAKPAINFNDLSPYKQAMRPNFFGDVDTVAADGASQYFIDVAVDPVSFADNSGVRLSGTEQIRYTNTEDVPLPEIYFRLYPNLLSYGGAMQVETVTINTQPVTPTLEAENSALRVPLPKTLLPKESINISLSFQSTVPINAQHGYKIFTYSDNTAAMANFYPSIAVFDDSGWHIEVPPPYGDATYMDTSLYQVQLTVPHPMVVAASGSTTGSTQNKDGTKTLSLVSGPMRDFYVVMHPDFKVATDVVDGITVNSYYPANKANGGRLALNYAIDSLRLFNQRFGAYPYAEFDVVATPTTAGGVEYPGIIVAGSRLYQDPDTFFQHVIGHEVAHQWWYGMVGNNQVTEPWLDEALTNYSTVLYWEDSEGQEQANAIIENFFLAPYEMAKEKNRAVFGPVNSFNQQDYGTFVYGKGPLFFHALRSEVGDETYFKIMQSYFAQHKYKIANAADLFAIIEEVTGRSIQPLVETWLEGK